jgi:ATP-binding cassette subfamily B protein
MRPFAKLATLAAGLDVVEVGLACLTPLVVAHGLTSVIRHDQHTFVTCLALLTAITTAQCVAGYVAQRLMTRFSNNYLADLRGTLLQQLFDLDLGYFQREPTGRIVARLTSDVESLQQFLENGIVMMLRANLLIVLTLSIMMTQSLILTGLVVACVLPLAFASIWYRRRSFAAQLIVRDANAEAVSHLSESLTAATAIQAYDARRPREIEFNQRSGTLAEARLASAVLTTKFQLALDVLPPICLAVVLFSGAILVDHELATVTSVFAATLYAARLFEPVQQLTELSALMQTASAAFAKVFSFLDTTPNVLDADGAGALNAGPGQIRLEHVTFRYAATEPAALDRVDLTIQAGERLALIGASGAGKSSLGKLLARFYDPEDGRVLLDGQDISTVQRRALRKEIALVPQEGLLFNGTIADNISLAVPGATTSQIHAACDALGIREHLLGSLPDGFDTHVRGGGRNLSAGQRQLISLARAFLAHPRVLILDEATSQLDPATELAIDRAFQALLHGRTSIVIAHRVRTALQADRAAVLQQGRIAELGAPSDLILAGGAFAHWAQIREAYAMPESG